MADETRTVDERVVEMQIDNKRFEAGASRTIRTLEKLEKALKIKTDDSKLDAINDSVSNFDATPMVKGLDAISVKMSALEVAGMRVIQNITDGIYNKVARAVKELTVGQISAGWSKYEQMIESTQTIMAATREKIGVDLQEGWTVDENGYIKDAIGHLQGFIDEASQMSAINEQLEKLLWFTDETSYNFNDMAANVGKFLSNGTDLEDTFTAMMGIASWGATAGAKPQQVSNAMYNISQAMGVGAMTAIDWKSIENAGMATKEFKQNVLEIARQQGILAEVMHEMDEDSRGFLVNFDESRLDEAGYIKDMTESEVDALITALNFRESLSQKWFNKDVMMEVFSQYGRFADVLHEETETTGAEATELLQALDAYREYVSNPNNDPNSFNWERYASAADSATDVFKDAILNLDSVGIAFSETGFRMGQEAKTFTDALEATKDAVSSKWMKSFQIIIGDYAEAKEFWSNVTEELYEIFAAGGDTRNDILSAWKDADVFGLGGRDYLFGKDIELFRDEVTGEVVIFQGAFWDLIDAIHSFADPISDAFADVFGLNNADIESTGHALRDFTKRFKQFTAQLKLSDEAQSGLRNIFKVIFSGVKLATKVVGGIIPIISSAAMIIGIIADSLLALFSGEFDPEVFFESLANGFRALLPSAEQFKNGIKNIGRFLLSLIPTEEELLTFFDNVAKYAVLAWNKLKQFFTLENLKAHLPTLEDINAVLDRIGNFLEERYPTLGKWFSELRGSSVLTNIFTNLTNLITNVSTGAKNFFSGIKISTEDAQSVLDKFVKVIDFIFVGLFGDPEILGQRITNFLQTAWKSLNDFVASIKFTDVIKTLRLGGFMYLLSEIIGAIKQFKEIEKSVNTIGESISGMFTDFGTAAKSFGKAFQADMYIKIAIAIGIIALSLYGLSKIDPDKLTHAAAIMIIILIIMSRISKTLAANKIFNKEVDIKKIQLVSDLAGVLIGLGVIIAAIGYAVARIAKIGDPKLIWNAVGAVAAIIVALGIVMGVLIAALNKVMKNFVATSAIGDTMIKVATSMVILAIAVRLLITPIISLATTMKLLGSNGESYVWQAAAIVGLALVVLSAIMIVLTKQMGWLKKAEVDLSVASTAFIKIAAAMIVLVVAIRMLVTPMIALASTMALLGEDSDKMWQALGVIGAIAGGFLLIIGVLSLIMAKFEDNEIDKVGNTLIKASVSMVIIALALRALMVPLIAIASLIADESVFENVKTAAIMMATAMVAIGLFAAFLGKWSGDGALKAAAAMLLIAIAINVLVPAITAFIAIAVSIAALAKNLKILTGTVIKLAVLSVAFVILSIGMVLFGAGVMLAGDGVLILAAGLALLALVLAPLSVGFPLFVEALANTSENMEKIKIGKILGLAAAFVAIALAIGALIKIFKKDNDVSEGIKNLVSKIISGIGSLFSKFGAKLAKHFPVILKAIAALLILAGLQFMELIPTLTNMMVKGLWTLLESINLAFSANKANIEHSVFGIVATILEVVIDALFWAGGVITSLIIELIEGFFQTIGMDKWAPGIYQDIKGIGDTLQNSLQDSWQLGSQDRHNMIQSWIPDKQEWVDATTELIESTKESNAELAATAATDLSDGVTTTFHDGMTSEESKAEASDAVGEFALSPLNNRELLGSINESYEGFGSDGGAGYINGFLDRIPDLQEAVRAFTQAGMTTMAETQESHSPSKAYARLGLYGVQGYAGAFEDNVGIALKSVTGFSNILLDAMARSMAQVAYVADEDFDISPRITPVVDLSNVNSAAGYMSGAFNSNYNIGATMANSLNRRISDAERLATAVSDARASQQIMGDNIEINVYPSPGQSSEEIANSVISKINDRLIRRGVAFG